MTNHFFITWTMFGRALLLVLMSPVVVNPPISGGLTMNHPSEWTSVLVGADVILPCPLDIPGDKKFPTVELSKEGLLPNSIFLVFRNGHEEDTAKNPAFENRTKLIIVNRTVSLQIGSVQLADAGTYMCKFIYNQTDMDNKTLQLAVGTVSEPKAWLVATDDGGLAVQCEATCCGPKCIMTLLDHQRNIIKTQYPDPDPGPEPSSCSTLTDNVTIPAQTVPRDVTCRVDQPETKESRETRIKTPVCMASSVWEVVGPILVVFSIGAIICALVVFLKWNSCRSGLPPKRDSESQTTIDQRPTSNHPTPPSIHTSPPPHHHSTTTYPNPEYSPDESHPLISKPAQDPNPAASTEEIHQKSTNSLQRKTLEPAACSPPPGPSSPQRLASFSVPQRTTRIPLVRSMSESGPRPHLNIMANYSPSFSSPNSYSVLSELAEDN